MPDINVTVTGTPPGTGSYSSSSNKVQSDGTITLNPGTTSVEFDRGSGQSWSFVDPWITFSDSGPFTVDTASCNAAQVVMSDNDPGGGQDRTYEYTLHTDQGNFDPEIINKGSN